MQASSNRWWPARQEEQGETDEGIDYMSQDPEYFDAYAARYEDILNTNLRVVGEASAAMVQYRMEYLRGRLGVLPLRVMDFGCGIGLAIPYLRKAFPGAHVVGVDVSWKSVERARELYAGERVQVCLNSELDRGDFDLVYSSGVFHHVPADQRQQEASFVFETLRPGGALMLAEHNPWNPVTRYLVSTCPFDEDAQLLRPKQATRMLAAVGFTILSTDYVGFFPGPLRKLRPLERYLLNIPAGAQYHILARRDE